MNAPDARNDELRLDGAAARPPAALRLMALGEVILCSGFPTQLVVFGLLLAAGLEPVGPEGRFSFAFVVALSLLDTVLLLALVIAFLRVHGERLRDLLLGTRPVRGEAVLGVQLIPLIFLLVLVLLAVIRTVAPWLHNVPENPLEQMLRTPRDLWTFALVVVVAGGLREEIQRAFILRRFEQYLGGGVVGLVIFSTAFGLGHLDQGYDAALATGLLGAFWGTVYLRRRSAVAPIVSHAGFNLAEIVRLGFFRN